MNKFADYLVSFGVVLIFGLLFLRDRIFGEPSSQSLSPVSITLVVVGFLLTFPVSLPSIIFGLILLRLTSPYRNQD